MAAVHSPPEAAVIDEKGAEDLIARFTRLGTGVESRLGSGSYGYVVPAWDCRAQRLVAMKRQPAASDDAVREMAFFYSLRGIEEPSNITRMYAAFVHDGTLTLVFEYMRSDVGEEWARAQGRLHLRLCQQ